MPNSNRLERVLAWMRSPSSLRWLIASTLVAGLAFKWVPNTGLERARKNSSSRSELTEELARFAHDLETSASLAEWSERRNFPELLLEQVLALKDRHPTEVNERLCRPLLEAAQNDPALLAHLDLALYHLERNVTPTQAKRASVPCMAELIGKLDAFWTAQETSVSAELKTDPNRATSRTVSLSRQRPNLELREREWILTFEGGPYPRAFPRLLDVLATRGVRALFFLSGRAASDHFQLVREAVERGHTLGTMGWHEPEQLPHALPLLSLREAAREIENGRSGVATASGAPVGFYRFPFGLASTPLEAAAYRSGMVAMGWTTDSEDWRTTDANRLLRDTLSRVRAEGQGVLRFSANSLQTVIALEPLLDTMIRENYRFVVPVLK